METTSGASSVPFRLEHSAEIAALRPVLQSHGYTVDRIVEVLGLKTLSHPWETQSDVLAALRRVAAPTPLNTLIRLFFVAQTVEAETVRAAIAPASLEGLVALGLLCREGGGVRSEVAIVPFTDLCFLQDFWSQVTGRPRPDSWVPGIGGATAAVANLTVRRRGETVLDLGTGSGYLALAAAEHAARVVATDINPRALAIAALNARLNGIDKIDWRLGSLYEPVGDERFDLIVANPPFVISPFREFQFRDSGLPGDAISEQVIRGAAGRLNDGGFCTVLFNWHHRSEEDWAERPAAWLRESGCDVWLLCFEHVDPLTYVLNWIRDTGSSPSILDEWLAYFEQERIGKISTGAVVLRRRPGGRNWLRADRAPSRHAAGSASDQIQRLFAAQTLLEGLDDERALLEQRFTLTADHQLRQTLRLEDGTWAVQQAELSQTRGLSYSGEVDRMVCAVLAQCDGQRTLGQIAAMLAGSLHADPEVVAGAVLGLAKNLLHNGFLVAVDPTDAAGT
jgi:methylase of polypeptide subunit release factors